jgi:hypothetical protein
LINRGAQLVRVRHAFESCRNEALGVDQKHPWIGLEPPLEDFRPELPCGEAH